MNIKCLIAVGLIVGAVTVCSGQYTNGNKHTTTTCEPTTTSSKPSTTTCELTTTTCEPTTTTCKCAITATPKPTTQPPPSWKAGVDEHAQKCIVALQFFVGPTHKTAKVLLDALLCLIPKLESSTKSSSLIISSKATEILENISIMTEVGNTPKGILNGFVGSLHCVCAGYRATVRSLEVILGISVSDVIDAIYNVEDAVFQVIDDLESVASLNSIDYKPLLKSIQKLTSVVACISESVLKNSENDADVSDCLYILALILEHFVIISHGANACIASELNERCGGISKSWSYCLKVVDDLLSGITKALSAAVNTVLEAVPSIVKAIVELVKSFNGILESVFGLVENVTATLTKTLSGVTGGLSNILKI